MRPLESGSGATLPEALSRRQLLRLKVVYGVALAFIAVTILSSSLLMLYALERNRGDSRVINLSGRQRMLSQRLTKCVLALERDPSAAATAGRPKEIGKSLQDWMAAHAGLQYGNPDLGLPTRKNSVEIERLFQEIESPYQEMVQAVTGVQRLSEVPDALSGNAELKRAATTMLASEPLFLKLMDQITFQFDAEAKSRLQGLKTLELVIPAVGLLVLLLEFLVVFHPSLTQLSRMVSALEQRSAELTLANFRLTEAMQKAELANTAKGDFLANMSHEIRTPMNAIIGMAHLALRTELTTKQQAYLTKIGSAANSLLGIINDLLDFSKIEVGKMELEHAAFSLDEVLDSLSDMVGQKAEQKGLEMVFSVAPETPRALLGDALRLGQILINLVTNAVKFTEHGEILIAVAPEELTGATARLRFSVRDTGIGMTPQQISGLFQSFSQADTSISRKYGCTGLGLAISKQLTELMGGRIRVESELGRGSTFSFTASFGIGQSVLPSSARVSLRELLGKRVLIVDDSDSAREVLTTMLTNKGFAVEAVQCGEESLSALTAASHGGTPFDLVLMDWRMPGMDGIEASRRIKADSTLSRTPAILMVTAFGREEVMKRAAENGLDGFLIKPVNESILIDTITEIFIRPSRGVISQASGPGLLDTPVHLVGRRILLVEDNEINRELATELLTDFGLCVETAENGRESVARATTEAFDLVLMDIQMPEMDGLTATRLIRADERLRDLPIIAMTANAMSSDREKSLAAGMNDYVTKPIDPARLLATLSRWIKAPPAPEQAVEQMPDEPVPSVSGDGLPDQLPPFNIPAALVRTNGKPKLLRKLILRFRDTYSQAAQDLRKLVAEGGLEEAERLAHSLKGVAGTLEARDVLQAAAAVEQAFREGRTAAIADLIAALDRALTPAIAAAASLGVLNSAAPRPSPGPAPLNFDHRDSAATLSELRSYVASNSLKARRCFAQLSGNLAGCGADAEVNELEVRLGQLDFPGALQALDRLTTKLARLGKTS
ncbi:MAG: response regulator [Planctomycetota bacterium]|nr:response regulator [Planctomycetota bacterium]